MIHGLWRPECGHWSPKNREKRPEGDQFKMDVFARVECKHRKDADENAARVIAMKRASDTDGNWRRGRDSNPRYALTHTRFPSVRLKPLGHPSGITQDNNIVAGSKIMAPNFR